MARDTGEPFHVALRHLRQMLQQGQLAPGDRITAVDLADKLRLSTTPVREALSRVAGEGLVEDRRGLGYFVPRLGALDIADLYRTSLAHLLIALDPQRPERLAASPAALLSPQDEHPVTLVEALFESWVAATGSSALVAAFRTVQVKLGPVRRLEAALFTDLAGEAESLRQLDESGGREERLARIRPFHAARIHEAERLAQLLAGAPRPR